jgi:hypothetical protein
MENGLSYNFLRDFGVMVNIPTNQWNVNLQDPRPGELDKFPEDEHFSPLRIVIDFDLIAEKEGMDERVCIPAKVFVFVMQEDLASGATFNDLKIADWDGSRWNVLVLNVERWLFPDPVAFDGAEYIGYITVDGCLPGDPPIALGT